MFPFEHIEGEINGKPTPLPDGKRIPLLNDPYTTNVPANALKIDHIFIWNDPRDWSVDIQIIHDLLISHQGYLGTVSNRNGNESSLLSVNSKSSSARPNQSSRAKKSSQGKSRTSKSAFRPGVFCHHCGKEGHIRPECRSLKSQSNPTTSRPAAKSGNQAQDRKSTRLNSSHSGESRMPSSA